MKVRRELTLDFFFFWLLFAFRGVCYLDKGMCFRFRAVLLLLRGSISI